MNCEQCKVEHDGSFASGRFCNRKCSRAFSTSKNRAHINEKVSLKLTQHVRLCKVCGESATQSRGGTGRYCINHKKKYRNEIFEDHKSPLGRKKFLLKKHGYRCWECGLEEWRGKPAPLQLDHIDGNSCNDLESNLRILCANCHAQTETFCGRNVNKNKVVRERKRTYARDQKINAPFP